MSFALNFFRNVAANKPGNFFVSPASVLTAMGIATAAAAEDTEAQLSEVLDLEGDYVVKHHRLGELAANLEGSNLTIANRLWVNDEYQLKSDFCNFVSDVYKVSTSTLDVSEPEDEAARINKWVAKKTQDKITDLINPDTINGDTLAILVNAIAYKGSWIHKFDPKNTHDGDWTLDDGSTIQVPVMYRNIECRYARKDTFRSIGLELDGNVTMVIMQPNDQPLDQFIANLTDEDVTSVLNSYERDVVVTLAKWKFEGTYDLVPTFKALGAVDCFDDSRANFHRMTDQQAYISDIVHKTNIVVNEEGAEMVAATKVGFALECVMMPLEFRTDRPFIYFAVDQASKTILFAGRVSDPRQES